MPRVIVTDKTWTVFHSDNSCSGVRVKVILKHFIHYYDLSFAASKLKMAFFNRREIGLKDVGHSVTVPNDPRAKLMYYLNCMCTVLRLDDNADINRLRRFQNYYTLDRSDVGVLISLCLLLKPDVLLNKCIFQEDALCGTFGNKFYDIEDVSRNLMVAGSIMIGGQQKRVTKIMTFKMSWLRENWQNPLTTLIAQQQREREAIQRQQQTSNACIIL